MDMAKITIGYTEMQRSCSNCGYSYKHCDRGVGEWLRCSLLDSMDGSNRKWNPVSVKGVCEKWKP